MKIKNIKDLGLPLGLLKEGTMSKSVDLLLPIIKRYLNYLNVGWTDTCCGDSGTAGEGGAGGGEGSNEILSQDGPLTGDSGDYIIGIDNSTGDIYYSDEDGNWQPATVSSTVPDPVTQDLVDGNWDYDLGSAARLTLTEDTTLNITNLEIGRVGALFLRQDEVGGWILTLPGLLPVDWGTLPVLPDSYSLLGFIFDGTNILWSRNDYGVVAPPPEPIQLDTPASLAATGTSDTIISVTWANIANEDNFQLEVSNDGTTGWATLSTLAANSLAYSHTGLAASTTKYYRLKALGDGVLYLDSAYTSVVSGVTLSAPVGTPPVLTQAQIIMTAFGHLGIGLYFNESVNNTGAGFVLYKDGVSVPFIPSTQAGIIASFTPSTPFVDGEVFGWTYDHTLGGITDLDGTPWDQDSGAMPQGPAIINEVQILDSQTHSATQIVLHISRPIHPFSDRKTGLTFKKNGVPMTITATPVNTTIYSTTYPVYEVAETILVGDVLTVSYDNTIGTMYDFNPQQNELASVTDLPVTNYVV